MVSATIHPEVVADYLQQELSRGRMLGPTHSFQGLPPSISTGWGLSLRDTTLGNGSLLNFILPTRADGIDTSLYSLSYNTVDDTADVVAQLGTGTLLAKVDIELAYWLIPVHPQDRPLQAINGIVESISILRFPSGFAQPPRSSMQ